MKIDFRFTVGFLLILFQASCSNGQQSQKTNTMSDTLQSDSTNLQTAVFAGGCFWCLDAVYRNMNGVTDVISGYSNGHIKNPAYREVCTGRTGHAEVVKVIFDTTVVHYNELLEVFWRVHDPTTLNRQGNDIGTQYRSGIYYLDSTQKDMAEKSMEAAAESGIWPNPIVTEILPLINFYPAEDYHQDYYSKNPAEGYCVYVVGKKVEIFKKLFSDKLKKTAGGNQP